MLTESTIRNAQPQARPYVLWDATTRGFGCRIFTGGQKSFVILYRIGDKKKWVTLARVGEMTLKDARARAAKELLTVRDGGQGLHERRHAIKHAPTFADLWTKFETEHGPERIQLGRLTKRTLQEYAKIMRRHVLPILGLSKVHAITRADVERTAKRMTHVPTLRNRALAILSRLFTWSETLEWRAQHSNPIKGIMRAREVSRDRVLAPDEMQRLNAALLALKGQHPFEVAAIFVAALSGLRIGEVISLTWPNVSLETSRATLPQTKVGRRVVVLSNPVKNILEDLPRFHDTDHVFPSHYIRRGQTSVTYKSVRSLFAKACDAAGIQNCTPHDLRRSMLTTLAAAGVGTFIIQSVAGHKSVATTQRYVALAASAVADASELGAAIVQDAMTKKDIDKYQETPYDKGIMT